MVDRDPAQEQRIEPFIRAIRALPFVQKVDLAPLVARDGLVITVTGRSRRAYQFLAEIKTSYFDRASVNSVIANTRLAQKQTRQRPLVLARYIPFPTGERFIAANVNFVDLVGNMYIVLGDQYERTILGRVEPRTPKEKQRVAPAQLQVLFLFATTPEATAWPVRKIGVQAGVGKSKAAYLRSELVEAGLVGAGPCGQLQITPAAQDLLVSGYARILRPKLVLGRYRAPEREVSEFLKRLPDAFGRARQRYALSGGPAANALQHFYQGQEAPILVSDNGAGLLQRLRLLPDRNGPITLLRAFGELVFWREVTPWIIAPPWLVYCELMNAEDPRAHEAAAELRREMLIQ